MKSYVAIHDSIHIYPPPCDVEIDNAATGIQFKYIPSYNYSSLFEDNMTDATITAANATSNIDISTGDNYTIYITLLMDIWYLLI